MCRERQISRRRGGTVIEVLAIQSNFGGCSLVLVVEIFTKRTMGADVNMIVEIVVVE